MRKYLVSIFLVCGSAFAQGPQYSNPLTLWYDQPASRFEEVLSLGNGRMRMMVYGGVESELINHTDVLVKAKGTSAKSIQENGYYQTSFNTVKGKKYSVLKKIT